MKFPSLIGLVKSAGHTLLRFPFVILISVIGTLLLIYLAEMDFDSSHHHHAIVIKLILTCTLGLTLLFSLNLIAERKIIAVKKSFLELAGLAILALYYILLPEELKFTSIVRFILFNISLHLLCAFAPFILKREPNGFWQYNKTLFLSILISLLYSFVLFAGLSIALLAIQNLFEVRIPDETYLYLFYCLLGIFNTWFFLSRIPSDFTALNDSIEYPKGLKIFTQFILLPLVTIYLIILYGYEFKILILWNLPQGWVSYLVLAFSIVGVLSLLLIYPIRNNKENKWILTFSKGFYFALFPLVILLFVAILTRMGDYGITENRYFILVLALWLSGIAAYFLLKKEASIKIIPVSLCLIGFLSSFGPWSAFYVAKKSQALRFENILNKNSVLKGNKIVLGSKELSKDDVSELSSILKFFEDRNELMEVATYFGPKADSIVGIDSYNKAAGLMELVGLKYSFYYGQNSDIYYNFSLVDKNVLIVRNFDYNLKFDYKNYNNNEENHPIFKIENKEFQIDFDKDLEQLSIKESILNPLVFDIKEFLAPYVKNLKPSDQSTSNFPIEKMSLIKENESYSVKLIIKSISGVKMKNDFEVNYMDLEILVKKK